MNEMELKQLFEEANDLKAEYPAWSGTTYAADWETAREVLASLGEYERQEGNTEQADKISTWVETAKSHENDTEKPAPEKIADAKTLENDFLELFETSLDNLASKVHEQELNEIGER